MCANMSKTRDPESQSLLDKAMTIDYGVAIVYNMELKRIITMLKELKINAEYFEEMPFDGRGSFPIQFLKFSPSELVKLPKYRTESDGLAYLLPTEKLTEKFNGCWYDGYHAFSTKQVHRGFSVMLFEVQWKNLGITPKWKPIIDYITNPIIEER